MSGKTEVDEEHMFSYGDDPEEGGRAESQLVIRTEDEAQLRQQMAPRPSNVVVGGWYGKPRQDRPHYHLSLPHISHQRPSPFASSPINSISLPASRVPCSDVPSAGPIKPFFVLK